MLQNLYAALNLAGTEATCANVHPSRSSVYDNANSLDIGRPRTLSPVLSVADVVAGHSSLFADLAKLTHS